MPTKRHLIEALSHPLRLKIIGSIGRERTSPEKLAVELDERMGRVAYHVEVLEKLGLIQLVEDDETENVYELVPPSFSQLGDSNLRCISAVFDEEGREEVTAAMSESEERISRAKARAAKRLAKAGGGGIDVTVVLANFESTDAEPKEKGGKDAGDR